MEVWAEPSRLYPCPFHEFQLRSVPLIPHSAIGETVLVRSLLFHILTRVENQPLKQWLKQKRRIIFTNIRLFSHSLSYRNIFCFIKISHFILIPTILSVIQNKKIVTGHSV